jgi:membrane-bound metal-dependent hydrolase YbcI (DUF457 family)
MAGFNTHISASTMVGVGYGLVGHFSLGMPLPVSAIGGCLCSLSGVLPDVDSDSGKPVREIAGFTAAVVPLLAIPRLEQYGLSPEAVAVSGVCIYLIVRFGLFELLRRYTVHRGMWHSIPAALVAGLAVALICADQQFEYRIFKAGAVVLGYLTHLLLDELWSLKPQRGRLRIKRSFGTAMKFWSRDTWANVSTYAKLIILSAVLLNDPTLRQRLPAEAESIHRLAREAIEWTADDQQQPWQQYR